MISRWIENELENIKLKSLNNILKDTKKDISLAIVDCYQLTEEPEKILIDVVRDTTNFAQIKVRLIYEGRDFEDSVLFKIKSNGDYIINWFLYYNML